MQFIKNFFTKVSAITISNTVHNLVSNHRKIAIGICLVLVFNTLSLFHATANAETRTLKLYNQNTKERLEVVYKKRGKYKKKGLQQLNEFMADWRKNESIKMDPKLFDLLWEIYQESGSTEEIHIVSAYRTPETNAMLRRRSKNVAFNSQHTKGKAIDFHLPDVELNKVRAIALRKQYGGVGYYPNARSPFTHLDTGEIRHWPRLTRNQLIDLFPDQETVHVPRDNRPLSGFQVAFAKVTDQGRVPMIVFDENNDVTDYDPGPIPQPKGIASSIIVASNNSSPVIKPKSTIVVATTQNIVQDTIKITETFAIQPTLKPDTVILLPKQKIATAQINTTFPQLKPGSLAQLQIASNISNPNENITSISDQSIAQVPHIQTSNNLSPIQTPVIEDQEFAEYQSAPFKPTLILAHSPESQISKLIDDLDLIFATKNPISLELIEETHSDSIETNNQQVTSIPSDSLIYDKINSANQITNSEHTVTKNEITFDDSVNVIEFKLNPFPEQQIVESYILRTYVESN